ncbi:MAG: succinyl-diaminopimelate desuccinylase [Alphaproteobacteria bacterium]|nr:succinyl-diaminopimelate desuccinylase [Alphaproteobacteria bacterium]
MTKQPVDPIALARALIRCPSVTPADAGALDVLQRALEGLGFNCHRLPFGGNGGGDGEARVDNLYARLGTEAPNFCFAGHTDVVPVGDPDGWSVDPFAGELKDEALWGRGAADMKGAIAAFVAGTARFLTARDGACPGSISLLITGDEEGEAVNGTAKVLQWLAAKGEAIDDCLVGEPTNPGALGEMIKIGRRGSLTAELTVIGVQGHTAYPHLADNPVHRLVAMLGAVIGDPLDEGSEHFQPSTIAVSTIDVGNPASNVIPGSARARLNVRFNDRHTGAGIEAWMRGHFDRAMRDAQGSYQLDIRVSGESFLTPPGRLAELVGKAVSKATGRTPELSTTGGTSDARFIKDHCPVVEFGLVGLTMHKADERVPLADIEALAGIYRLVLEAYFQAT